ncbi:uncharacterized protein LOC128397626 [Panonychus citri]|uniref:uncharacterized protein LOC128393188 n=1 Tax=Panonychus citri TaxID=50023 RepID=UPI002306EB13|nr:uncharacterized protein LOC128393188 [Panonychus citri]XP_053214339.1 uncharacterized protein LOC128397626 [Panonychus citri]
MDLHDNAKKVVVCSALFAGFAYFSLSVLRNVFSPSKDQSSSTNNNNNNNKNGRKSSQCVQTEVSVPIKEDKRWYKLPPEMWGPWAKTIQDRIKELNLQSTANNVIFRSPGRIQSITTNGTSLSSHNTPRNSPRCRSPNNLSKENSLSRSVDNLSKDNNNHLHQGDHLIDGPIIKPPSEIEMINYKKILDKLFGQKNPNLSQQEASVLGMLLMCDDDEVLVKTLTVIADCAVFTPNINVICDSGCLVMLLHLLNSSTIPAVIASTTQAIGNLANGERSQELMRPFIIPLMDKLKTASHLQLTWSLIALANLAHRDSNHIDFLDHLNELIVLIEKGCTRVQLQSLKILVNLSCNQNSIVYLLAARCPVNLYNLLIPTTDEEILIRLCSFISNLVESVFRRSIKHTHLPTINKVASPETLYSGLFGVQAVETIKEKLKTLSRYPNENIVSSVQKIEKKLILL